MSTTGPATLAGDTSTTTARVSVPPPAAARGEVISTRRPSAEHASAVLRAMLDGKVPSAITAGSVNHVPTKSFRAS